jgi:hypothetical protein
LFEHEIVDVMPIPAWLLAAEFVQAQEASANAPLHQKAIEKAAQQAVEAVGRTSS